MGQNISALFLNISCFIVYIEFCQDCNIISRYSIFNYKYFNLKQFLLYSEKCLKKTEEVKIIFHLKKNHVL